MSFHPTLPQIVTYILCRVTLGNPIQGATMYTVSPWDPPASTDFVTHNQRAAEQTMDTHPTLGNNKLRHHFKKQKMRRKKWMKKILTLPMHLSRSENFLIFMINCFVSLLFFRCTWENQFTEHFGKAEDSQTLHTGSPLPGIHPRETLVHVHKTYITLSPIVLFQMGQMVSLVDGLKHRGFGG